MIPAYACRCSGCGKKWVAVFDEGCRADADGTSLFGVQCPACFHPTGVGVEGPAHFESVDEAYAYFEKKPAQVIPFTPRSNT